MSILLKLVALMPCLGHAQGPFDGMSKSTLAAETDPLGAMAFVQRYFGATPDSDSCAANVCLCAAGDSSAATPWQTVLGRSDLEKKGNPAGQCWLHTAGASLVPAAEGTVAVVPSGQPGVDCTYKDSREVFAAPGDSGYVVHAHDSDTCCKSCAALSTCTGATYIPYPNASTSALQSSGGIYSPPTYEGFGLHLPAVAAHVTTGGLTVREVEAIVARKVGAMRSFDAWLDFNVALYTVEMDAYLERFESDGVPYLGAAWDTSDGRRLFSVFVLIPSSTLVIELMGSTSSILTARASELVELEQRLSATRLRTLDAAPPARGLLLPVRVSRASSNLTALDEFYLGAMRINSTLVLGEQDVQSRCYEWPGGKVDICFVQRPEDGTSSELSVAGFEAMLKHVADVVVTKPTCNMNRWTDNHYAVDLLDEKEGTFDYIIDYLENTPGALYQCNVFHSAGLHYIYDPTGWAVQLNMAFSKTPSGCVSVGTVNPMCAGGTCADPVLVV